VFIQESLQLQPTRLFPGFTVFDHLAVVTGGRPSGGLSTLLKRSTFGSATLSVVCSEPHPLAVLVTWPSCGVLLCNVYAPLSSRTTEKDFYRQLAVQVAALTEIHVPAVSVVAGDFNAHLFRPVKAYDRKFVWLVEQWKSEAFVYGPAQERPFSYVSGNTATTIDYAFFRGAKDVSCHIGPLFIAQHRPVLATFKLPPSVNPQQEPALGTAYWKSKARQNDFPVAIQGLGTVTSCQTHFALQTYVDRFYNVLQLYAKKRPKKARTESWEIFLTDEDRNELRSARDEITDLMVEADADPNVRTVAQEKRKCLEMLVSVMTKKASLRSGNRETCRVSIKSYQRMASSCEDAWHPEPMPHPNSQARRTLR
jgi:hypothetical protein